MMSLFGNMFDFNHDGKLDAFERTMEFAYWEELGREDESSSDYENDDDYDLEFMDSDEIQEELEDAGLDLDDLEFMDPDERREALEDAGLDPDDYDF